MWGLKSGMICIKSENKNKSTFMDILHVNNVMYLFLEQIIFDGGKLLLKNF